MIKLNASILAFALVFVMILVPSLHVPMLSDDYYYYYAVGSSLLGQYQHYMWWSGRIITNMISGYMTNWLPRPVYETITALIFSVMLFIYACLPSLVSERKFKPHWTAVLLIFIFYWITNPSLGETSFWFVGAANYVWPNFFVAVYMATVLMIQDKPSILKSILFFVIGILAGCSNENTCVVVIILSIAYIVYNKNFRTLAPHFIGLIIGSCVLLFSPGGAARSKVFTWWHSLSLTGKFDEQFFTRMPDAMQTYWMTYLLIIVLAICISMLGIISRKNVIYAAIFFVAAVLSNMAFIGAPYMPTRAYNGAMCFMLISASFLIHALVTHSNTRQQVLALAIPFSFGLIYFIPSYSMFTYGVIKTWDQERVRKYMIQEQLNTGVKDIVIPDHYFSRLLKKTDGYPAYKQPIVKDFYKVNSFTEQPVVFDYSSLDSIPSYTANFEIDSGLYLQKIYLYTETLTGRKLILFQINNDINKEFAQGKALFVHANVKGKEGFVNLDTANPAIKIADSWYTYSDVTEKGINLSDIESVSVGVYQTSPLKTLSQFDLKL